jgi:two-component system cell cycle sensor histidine kinase/response regulator CckA
VRADRGQLEQVLANLAVNARDAMPYGGELVVEVSALDLSPEDARPASGLGAGPYVALTVSDEGTGIAPEVQAHLFEPFFTTKDQGKGTGLGLSVVYGIVRQSGGDILVESEPGRGATFRILLPRVTEPDLPVDPGGLHGPLAAASTGAGTILLVEDESAVRALARDFLHVFGYEVVEASSGEEAIAIYERRPDAFRGVVTDIVMPGMSGVELARHLMALQPGLRILLVSGYARDAFADDLTREGFFFLQKPYALEDFGKKIAEMMAGSSVGDRSARS